MLALAGALTTFSVQVHPRDFPAYDHDNLGPCFTKLDEKLHLLLKQWCRAISFRCHSELVQPSIYATSIDRDEYLVNTRMYLAIKAETDQADLIGKTPQLVECVGGPGGTPRATSASRSAADARTVPPDAIPLKLGFQYFSLNPKGPQWDSIGKSRNLAAYVPADLPNPQMELIILLPQPS